MGLLSTFSFDPFSRNHNRPKVGSWQLELQAVAVQMLFLSSKNQLYPCGEHWPWLTLPGFNCCVVCYVLYEQVHEVITRVATVSTAVGIWARRRQSLGGYIGVMGAETGLGFVSAEIRLSRNMSLLHIVRALSIVCTYIHTCSVSPFLAHHLFIPDSLYLWQKYGNLHAGCTTNFGHGAAYEVWGMHPA